MNIPPLHSFHIPVLGLGYSIDTPVKVARFGISSVISIVDDQLVEKMREFYHQQQHTPYQPITDMQEDFRAKRICCYLNLVQEIVQQQMQQLTALPFEANNELYQYFQLLPETAAIKRRFLEMNSMPEGPAKQLLQQQLRQLVTAGAIDVNIMAKVDRMNTDAEGNALPSEYSDALSALRGFAQSNLQSSVILSAGYNPRLYNYIEQFAGFFPDENGYVKKKIILKVSDFRSALVQGKLLAKKGIWVSEFRIESGLNCGGHAFATEGLLLGPILEEFKTKRAALAEELLSICNAALLARQQTTYATLPALKITVQGGIGTANENDFLLEHYAVNGTGWGSPFLLVPEATNVDNTTLQQLATAQQDDYYISDASPLGVPFNNFRKSSAEAQRQQRMDKGRPGSPCMKKYLSADTEFTEAPICTASRQYQHLKIKQLEEKNLSPEEYQKALQNITSKDCLCEGLGAATLLKENIPTAYPAVTICPGPNLAYFSGVHTLQEMVDHIYGRLNILNSLYRPNMFVNELHLYIDYWKKNIENACTLSPKQVKYFQSFKSNLLEGIQYYKLLAVQFKKESSQYITVMKDELDKAMQVLTSQPIAIDSTLPT
ncbi:hypothetical protein SAMN05421788_10687 [Filimonas lacunae]|uniref:Uncharacterized protein n=1 Tax=Filimonas lacunae TaxID=477680 RepID=A0A173MEL7_9BACT|nr:hypothetical protein [Filimonas lacunae]BAV06015.1 hypothetical protein FLA_2030 [Filimonas lacunae]SIT24204.1 hypothetical protein SAMN05421788_10687 [Filimonas lacunae]